MDMKKPMDGMPKKEALMGIIKAMKELKLEKLKGYKKAEDEEPSMEVEVEEVSKEKADKIKDMFGDEDEEEEV